MFKRLVRSLVALSILGSAVLPAQAGSCNLDNNPAATLLLPYFEVDTVRRDGVNTVFAVSNAFATAQLAHVTVWSDLSSPIFDFNVYLTGYDMVTFDLRRILVDGVLPTTASDGQDPTDTISPQGPFSQDINYASCVGQLPLPPALPAIFLTHLKSALTGGPSPIFGGLCAGRNLGDKIARGYITVDVVNNCTLRFATDLGYFGPGGDATDDNALFGDYTLIGRERSGSVSQPLVAIQASASDAATTTPGNYTFYGRFVSWSAADHREPLATTFGARYQAGRNDLIVWRDAKKVVNPFTCGTTPSPFPLGLESAVYFDEQENPEVPATSPVSPAASGLTAFGAEAQRVAVDGAAMPVTASSGWLYLNLNTTVTGSPNPPADPAAAQAWVGVLSKNGDGRLLSGYDAMRYDSACQANHTNPGN